MAVEKLADGTFLASGMTFATAEEAFAYDAAKKAEPTTVNGPTNDPLKYAAAGRRPQAKPVARAPRSPWTPYGVGVLIIGIAAALYFGPYWTLYRMKAAINAHDATAFSDHVDFPSLKESFKAQMLVKMGQVMNADSMKDNPFAGLGQMIGMGMVNQMVDTLVSPAGVMLMMEQGKASAAKVTAAEPTSNSKQPPNFAIDYVNYSTVQVRSKDGSPGRFVFRRDGIFSWKLSAIEIPL